ncbi:ATP synthase F0 subcomplex B subunit [Loktanella fryxellensis]|uniref:ATP synthase subunit b n=1 Tax=Loktanella fryxellensis TaxID=245187 RepID=A0A1H8CT65_9RHOB|nr:F0F1 ATP synthase subunit B [Loktanella fryxellensis]SEM97337.1 ATP synthase F0 subcomplex B subunit [Loktanella fryxellensis]
MRYLSIPLFLLTASPALAATGPFISLANTNFIVTLAFIVFVGILMYMKVPSKIGAMLDARADSIRADLDEARSLREEAQTLLASYERKQREMLEQADRIVTNARADAERAAQTSKDEIAASIARRLAGAEEQLESARAAAVKDVQNRAVTVAVAAAKDVIARQMDAGRASALIDESIATVKDKIH